MNSKSRKNPLEREQKMYNNSNEQSTQDLRKQRSEAMKDKAKAKFEEVKVWAEDHKELLMVLVPSAVVVLAYERKRRVAKKANYNDKGRYVYDARLGHWWQLKRKPSSSEWAKIVEARYLDGSSLESILSTMGLIH